MNIALKARMYYPLLAILLVGLLCACGNPSSAVPPPTEEPSTSPAVTPPTEQPSEQTETTTARSRVDVVYFHRPRRCVTCLCFEERIRHVVTTYFQDEVDRGKLTLEIVNLGDKESAAIINKYGAFGPQLFINTVRNGADDIRDIEEIWSWGCRSDKEGFDQAARNLIEQSLEEVQ